MFGAVCFHSSLTQENSRQLELQQKRSLACILGSEYRSYRHALEVTLLPRLDQLREDACVKWAMKAQANPQHTQLFPINHSEVDTRSRQSFKEYKCKGAKYYNSAVPHMVRTLNSLQFQPAGSNKEVRITTNSGATIIVWSKPYVSSERWYGVKLPGRVPWYHIYHCFFINKNHQYNTQYTVYSSSHIQYTPPHTASFSCGGLQPRLFWPFRQKESLLCYFGPF